ncbi:DUF1648 domain-containing protein [Cellulosilyticum lentocellum]|uniref:DUF1648 domain-containing protein n=1 Tax=Cellulosilyticum lentocellum (strain ATCC 49066 / DSM 5427 / NCIMB 11756 / RHM5) TaxID=642492 RepID=F2JHA6_CELLD|nr:DUF1648 domain-containing protein [Cellulosilyticum lentocellum]ADZ83004.1 protein of unknown function DUF1648 [Cellulosilyticum lentocellum DSM 5427]
MTNTTFTILSVIGTNVILYILFILTPYFSTADTYMGIFLEHAYRQTPEAKKILKSFLIHTTITFIITTLMILLLLIKIPVLNHSPLLGGILLLETLLYFVVYGKSYAQTKAYKKSLNLPQPTGGKLLIDTAFMEQKNKIKMIYKKLLYIPLVIGLFLGAYTLYHYNEMPQLIPTHFNIVGEIDGWANKNIATALFPSGMTILITLLFSYSLDSAFNKRSKLSKEQLEKGKTVILKYLKWSALTILILVFAITSMMMGIVFSTVQGVTLTPIYNYLSVGAIFLSVILMGYNSYCYKRNLPYKEENEAYLPPEEQDDYWLWGLFYNNPNDPAVLVAKRHGLGWTINIGSFKGKLIILVTLLVIIGAIIFSSY